MAYKVLLFAVVLSVAEIDTSVRDTLSSGLGIIPEDTGRYFAHLMALERYEDALSIGDSLIRSNPNEPEGYFLSALVYNNRSIDYEDTEDYPALGIMCDSVRSICSQLIDAGDNSARLRFYLGTVEGFRMLKMVREREFIKALITGGNAAKQLEDAITRDPALYDAYVGLGNYYYFKSQYSGLLRSTGLVSDRREDGIKYLQIAAEKGILTRLAGESSLAWIAISRGEYSTAIEIANSMLERYPDNRAFLWCLGNAQKKSGDWEGAIKTYSKILESLRKLKRNNYHNEISCLNSLAISYYKLERWSTAGVIAEEALNLPVEPSVAKRKEKDLKNLRKIRKNSLNRNSNQGDINFDEQDE